MVSGTVGFVGLGNMGGRMARRLVAAGITVVGHDPAPGRAEAAGAEPAALAELDLPQLLDVINSSSGVNFATLNRFPRIVTGDYLEGGLTSRLMTKDVTLYLELVGRLGVPSLNSAGPLASFGLAENLGYGDQISNRVVDAIGDVSGGVRLSERN
jgi:3-hydroxyisobutyrate dehydrogenase-like beta-hydroxyacid dehydrogenase